MNQGVEELNHHEMETTVARIIKTRNVCWYDDPHTNTRHIYTKDIRKPLTVGEKKYIKNYFNLIAFPKRIIFD